MVTFHSITFARLFRIDHVNQLHFIGNIQMRVVYVFIEEWFGFFFVVMLPCHGFVCNLDVERDGFGICESKRRGSFELFLLVRVSVLPVRDHSQITPAKILKSRPPFTVWRNSQTL